MFRVERKVWRRRFPSSATALPGLIGIITLANPEIFPGSRKRRLELRALWPDDPRPPVTHISDLSKAPCCEVDLDIQIDSLSTSSQGNKLFATPTRQPHVILKGWCLFVTIPRTPTSTTTKKRPLCGNEYVGM